MLTAVVLVAALGQGMWEPRATGLAPWRLVEQRVG